MKTNKWIYTAVLGLLFASCQSVETPMFTDAEDTFVAFNSKTTSIAENAGKEVKIPVSMVASKCYDATVYFTVDASAYTEAGTAAKEGVNYRVKGESNSLTFTDGGDLTQYIVIEPIDNNTFDGDVYFDITLTFDEVTRCRCHENGIHINLGANYTTSVVLTDDDHPLKAAGILGSYAGAGISAFDGVTPVNWTMEITSDPGNVNGVWISQLGESVAGASYKPIYGKVSDDKNSILIEGGQDVGTYGSYTLKLDFPNPSTGASATSVTALRSGDGFSINAIVGYAAYEGTEAAGYITAAAAVTLTKVGE